MAKKRKEEHTIGQEVNNIRTKALSSDKWRELENEIKEFCNTTRRTWSNATLYLLEKALKESKEKGEY